MARLVSKFLVHGSFPHLLISFNIHFHHKGSAKAEQQSNTLRDNDLCARHARSPPVTTQSGSETQPRAVSKRIQLRRFFFQAGPCFFGGFFCFSSFTCQRIESNTLKQFSLKTCCCAGLHSAERRESAREEVV